MACKHINAAELKPAGPTQSVHREDCTQCFDSIDDPSGLDVCLYCFNGGCLGERNHSLLHVESTGHPLVLNIKRTRKKTRREEPPQKVTKLSIAAETESDRYDTTTQVKCYECGVDDVDKSSGMLPELVDAVLKANTFARSEEVKAWEQELTACEHTLYPNQEEPRNIDSQDLGHCSKCDLKENLWLCLTCGNLGCGRAQFGGIGGNSHGVGHTKESGHTVAVKLGSLTADGDADIYCYSCDEERVDPELPAHLAHWGINIADRQKTEKSLTEMQVEQNLLWEFSMTTEDGKELKPLFGEGFTGLKNLGNSCYMNSVLQSLFDMPEFQTRYNHPKDTPPPAQAPAEDLETQLRKVADGLLSGRYSKPDSDVFVSESSPEVPHQKGLAPAMLKHLVGRGHVEFSTMRQQDSYEFLLHFLKLITRSSHPSPLKDPVEAFRFVMEQRLQCLNCKKVRYRTDEQENISIPVPIRRIPKESQMDVTNSNGKEKEKEEFEPVTLKECLDIFTADELVELSCPSCGSKDGFTKSSRFKTFPQILAVNARRFELVNWVPTKLDVPVIVDDEPFSFDAYKSHGLQQNEESLPEDTVGPSTSHAFIPNEAALAMLETMGFPRIRCEKALHATGNADPDAASNWLFAHMEDPDIDDLVDLSSGGGAGGGASGVVDPEKIESLGMMGFNAPQARQALKETSGDMERAVDWLFNHPDAEGDFGGGNPANGGDGGDGGSSGEEKGIPGAESGTYVLRSIVCHKGSSIHAGHYVAFVRKNIPGEDQPSWVLFNDEKVAKAGDIDEIKKFAYVYFFRRV
ncbi:ubiquitin carboxyl-terminal hydrolase 14 [Tothia fuscella]|uniref:Ubiquitin carboxyl-terminal hydrolase n=1 Tax=Tothia fuscella TaxID=1048955 RepID=A0A9P4P2T7_9PEZI|nr:ubiquitin carboxyl-terminal hydrolase 14 [Tothia fuscella]